MSLQRAWTAGPRRALQQTQPVACRPSGWAMPSIQQQSHAAVLRWVAGRMQSCQQQDTERQRRQQQLSAQRPSQRQWQKPTPPQHWPQQRWQHLACLAPAQGQCSSSSSSRLLNLISCSRLHPMAAAWSRAPTCSQSQERLCCCRPLHTASKPWPPSTPATAAAGGPDRQASSSGQG